jgi:hypothetical protein
MDNKIFIECSCGTELIQLERDPYPKESQDIYMSFFRYGHNGNFPLSLRLQYIWQIITKGHPYSDCVILNKQEQDKLIKFLVSEK